MDSKYDVSTILPYDFEPMHPAYRNIGGEEMANSSPFYGSISDVMMLDITCEKEDINFLGGIMTPQMNTTDNTRPPRSLPINCSPAWWSIIPLVGQIALYNSAVCSAETIYSPESIENIIKSIYNALSLAPNSAIPPGKLIDRSMINISESTRIHIDVGGEGPINSYGIQSGFHGSINLQAADGIFGDGTKQTQPPNGLIPNLVRMAHWNQKYPFSDKFADYITMQNAPLTNNNVAEIARVIKPNGEIAFWIDLNDKFGGKTYKQQIEELAIKLKGKILYNDTDEFNGKAGNHKTTIILHHSHDEP